MSTFRLRCPHFRVIRRFSSLPEYSEKPEYPPILDLSRDAVKKREQEAWHDKVKGLQSVEEKLMEINMPKYYGWPCIALYEGKVPYNSLHFAQYITRTNIIKQLALPEFYQSTGIVDRCAPMLEHLKNPIQEAIALEYAIQRSQSTSTDKPEENINDIGDAVVHQINRVIMSSLSADVPHLQQCEVDHFPRIESFWIVGGIYPSSKLEKLREKNCKDDLGKKRDMKFQYLGRPLAQIRHSLPLPSIVDESEVQEAVEHVPLFQYDPRVLGVDKQRRHLTNIPGFWPGDVSEFPIMSFHTLKPLNQRNPLLDDSSDAPYVQAILASFAWLQALACYKGFSTFHDVTYPIVTQTILTDGQYWSFFIYQLNTMVLHSNNATDSVKCNFCWGTEKLKLYEKVENGKVIGFNEDVLKILLYFYLNVPTNHSGRELKPYLGAEKKYLADIPDAELRVWLEKRFKHMYSNRPRDRLPYEIYNWEEIYKIRHKTRPMEARRRPFELNQNPLEKRYDDHTPRYIPKALRKEGEKRKKFEDTFYP